MNRERKYRVWDISHKTFLPTDVYALITSDFGAFGIMLKDWDNYKEGEYLYPNSQIQSDFTGLLDKNGKEIYEGDIYNMGDNTITYTVVWNDSGFIGKQNGSSSYAGLEYWMDRIEIIGNIYENPNLIN